jgi:thiol-disulfide isomerase/thioredoxin
MARFLPLVALLLVLPACKKNSEAEPASADEPKDEKLTVGVPAPPLAADRWLRGEPVQGFAPGRAYVVEFWATWCAPCLAAMGHLDEVARKFRKDGLTVVAVTVTDDRGNSDFAIDKFLHGRGKDLDFTFAVFDKPDIKKAYLAASGNTSLPATFVVDRSGAVAYIGHPDDLDEVVPKVLAGTWKGATDVEAFQRQQAELDDIYAKIEHAADQAQAAASRRPGAAAIVNKAIEKAAAEVAEDLDKYAEKYPGRAAKSVFRINRARILLISKRYSDAKAVTEPVLEAAVARRSTDELGMVVDVWTDKGLNPERRFPELAVKAADAALATEGENDVAALMAAARAYLFAGEKVRGRAYADKAGDLLPDPRQRVQMEKALREYE